MDDVVEKVARALFDQNQVEREMFAGAPDWDELSDYHPFYMAFARAAIAAHLAALSEAGMAVVPRDG